MPPSVWANARSVSIPTTLPSVDAKFEAAPAVARYCGGAAFATVDDSDGLAEPRAIPESTRPVTIAAALPPIEPTDKNTIDAAIEHIAAITIFRSPTRMAIAPATGADKVKAIGLGSMKNAVRATP